MKSVVAFLLCITAGFGFDYNLTPQKINESVYCFFGDTHEPNTINNGFMANSCYIREKDFFIVVDSGPTYIFAKNSHDAMKKIANLPVKYVINTHSHDDHFLGNGYFKSQGALIYASAKFNENRNDGRMQEYILISAFEGTQTVLPDIFLEQETIQISNTKIFNPKIHGHTTGDIVILHIPSKTLFVGDLVFNDRVLSLRDGSLHGWLTYLDHIQQYPYETMISGHGSDTSKNSFVKTRIYLERLKAVVQKAIHNGIGIDEAAKTNPFEDFASQNLYNELHSKNIFKAYQLLEWE